MQKNTALTLNSIAFTIISILVGILPFFFLPSTVSGAGAVKGVLLYVGVLVAFSLWVVGHFLEGNVRFIKHPLLLALSVWALLSFVGALTSRNVGVSLWGRGFVVDSFATTGVIALLVLLVSSFAVQRERLMRLFFAAFLGSVITLVLQVLLYLFQGTAFIGKYFSSVAGQGTILGSWVDFAYFTVFTFLLGLLALEILHPKRLIKWVSITAVAVSLFVLIFLNYSTAWIIAIAAALLVFVYKSSVYRFTQQAAIKKTRVAKADGAEAVAAPSVEGDRFPLASFLSLLVGLFFYLSANSIGMTLANYARLTFSDIRPALSTTTHVMRATLARDPLFGAGQGRYSEVWNLYHSADINKTAFWNNTFDSGFGFIPSVITTNGIVPSLALLAFLGYALVISFRLFKKTFTDNTVRFVAITSIIVTLGFVLLLFTSTPGFVLITLGFVFIALLLGLSVLVGETETMPFDYLKDPRTSFFTILVLVIAAMAGFSGAYFSGNRFASIVYYNRALIAADATTAQSRLDRALSLSQNDIYWRTRTALFTGQFNSMVSNQNADKAALQSLFTQAEQSANAAVAWDATNANNWLALSQVYQLVAGSNNAEAATNSKKAAAEAQSRNPNNPVFFLNNAQIALTQQNKDGASAAIAQALALKPDYLDAFLMRGQIARSAGDTQAVKNEILAYLKIAPFDEQAYTLLAQAAYDLKDYQTTLSAIGQLRQIAPYNPNYYLQYVAVLDTMGNKQQAVQELKNFKVRFPAIQGVDEQIKRITAGQTQEAAPAPAAAAAVQASTATVSPQVKAKVAPKRKR